MPFDAADYRPEPVPPEPPPRRHGGAALLVIIVSVIVLAAPFSLSACSDMIRYARTR